MPVEAGAGGAPAPNVSFEWAQSLPRRGMCSSGVFVGTFMCIVQNSLPSRIDGTIVLELVGPSENQLLDVGNGTVTLLVDPSGSTAINTKVTGKVECMGRLFTGEIPETTFTPDQSGVLFQLFSGLLCASGNTAQGKLVGLLDTNSLGLAGDVTLMIGTCNCAGKFDLRAQ